MPEINVHRVSLFLLIKISFHFYLTHTAFMVLCRREKEEKERKERPRRRSSSYSDWTLVVKVLQISCSNGHKKSSLHFVKMFSLFLYFPFFFCRLQLVDNGIDSNGEGSFVAPIILMRSVCIKTDEIDIYLNHFHLLFFNSWHMSPSSMPQPLMQIVQEADQLLGRIGGAGSSV